jgi:hypothetical protein
MSKRQKTQTYDWKLTLSTPQTFKTLLAIVEPTVANVPFQVCMDTSEEGGAPFTGLRLDAMNSSKVCMVKAAYECDVQVSDTLRNEMFCVDTDMLRNLLRDVQASHEIEMIRYTNDASVTINTHDMSDPTNWSVSTIQLMDVDFNTIDLDMNDITFKYVVEMELDRLKHVCRMVNSIRSTLIEFRVDETEAPRHHFFSITADGEGATIRKVHQSSAVADGDVQHITVVHDTQVACEAVDTQDLLPKFHGRFPIIYMNGVLKSMDRQSIQLFLGQDLPLVMSYGLGSESSYIKILLAPRDDE